MTTHGQDRARMEESVGLIFAHVLDSKGRSRELLWHEIQGWRPLAPGEVLWVHLDRTVDGIADWLGDELNIASSTVAVLTSNETRPRTFIENGALTAVLRGINLNPGANPEDMIAMQIWADGSRVISLRRRRLQTPHDVIATLERGAGPKTSGDLVTELIEQMVAKMNRTIVDTNDRIDRLEVDEDDRSITETLGEITKIRRYCLALKRFMTPQHAALLDLMRAVPDWMSEDNRRDIRETIDRLQKYLDDLDVSKESALVIQHDLNNQAANQANKTMYMLSLVAAIFLPLGFLTGLLGINVGGMPGTDSPSAFWITIAVLAVLLAIQIGIFKRLRWF